jgi:hypothetical protein
VTFVTENTGRRRKKRNRAIFEAINTENYTK